MKSEYENFAENFSKTRENFWPEFNLLIPYIQKGKRVLDLGCGNGRLRSFLSPEILADGNYFGVDNSEKLLKIAREKFPRDYFFYADFSQKLPFGENNFDIVVAIASFHHLLSKKSQKKFLSECLRILKPNGILFITTWKLPLKFLIPNLLKGRWKNWNIPFGVNKYERTYRRTNAQELKRLLISENFKVEKCSLERNKNFVIVGRKC